MIAAAVPNTSTSFVNKPSGFLSNTPAGRALRVGVLNNPLSGGNRKGLGAVIKIQAAHPGVVHQEVQTPAEVAAALDDFARKEVDVIAINGGDGTVQAVLSGLFYAKPFATPPLLAVLSAGTTSMIAGDVGLQGGRTKALQRLFAWAQSTERRTDIVQRPVLRMQLEADRDPLFGMFFGAGAIFQGIEFCRSRIHRLGLRGELGPGLALARF